MTGINVVCVTGTPGVGKTTISLNVKKKLLGTNMFEFLNVGDLIKEKELFSEWDDEMNCSIFDEDLVNEEIKRIVASLKRDGKKGLLIDFHSVGFLQRRLVDHVVVIRADTNVLWARLEERKYPTEKIQENVQAEIFMESKSEAEDQFGEDRVIEKLNNSVSERDEIVDLIVELLMKQREPNDEDEESLSDEDSLSYDEDSVSDGDYSEFSSENSQD